MMDGSSTIYDVLIMNKFIKDFYFAFTLIKKTKTNKELQEIKY